MSAFKEACLSQFGTDDLYAILEISRNANENEIKRGYYKVSLKTHPDRVSENKALATEKFQTLGKVHAVLSDKEKRAIYDETGDVDDESCFDEVKDWNAYFRLLYPTLTLKSIKNFEKKYKGSSEELEDLKCAYEKHQGDMDMIMQTVMCATLDDEERFRNILIDLVEDDSLPSYSKFINEPTKKKQKRHNTLQKEAEEAEVERRKLGIDEADDSLKSLIQRRQNERGNQADDFFKHLEDKYGKKETKSKSSKRKAK